MDLKASWSGSTVFSIKDKSSLSRIRVKKLHNVACAIYY